MPWGLENVSDTYQRAMVVIFHDMLYEFLEDYVDNMKSRKVSQWCWQYDLRKNTLKCAFSVSSNKFLDSRPIEKESTLI